MTVNIKCEHECTNRMDIDHTYIHNAHSIIMVLQKLHVTDGYTYHQCEEGEPVGGMRYQHYCCCHDHAILSAIDCVGNHLDEANLHPPYLGFSNLHKFILNTGLKCSHCSVDLVSVAYRITVEKATPTSYVYGETFSDLGGWCCSLDHAKEYTISSLSNWKELT